MREYAIVTAGGKIDDDFALRVLSERKICGSGAGERTEEAASMRPFVVAADRGLVFLDRHGIVPDLVVGDFDSAGEAYVQQYLHRHPEVQVRSFHWEKDDTDTEIAARQAVQAGCRQIDFLGATGSRFDHVLGNVQVLHMLLEQGVTGRILDPCNRITMHRESFRILRSEQWGKYVSFFAWGGDVEELTLKGFHFPMTGGRLIPSRAIAVSNQIEDEIAEVSFRGGRLLMVESKDTP